jgi:hypothetical protein
VKRRLERIEIPGEHEARDRAWAVLQTAFSERGPVERRARHLRVAAALAVVLAVLGAAFSSPGRAVLDEIRETVGVENAAPALFRVPAPGKLLVHSEEGVWVVQQDGSRRLLGSYREASWSPFGRFVVAAGDNELAALEPDGDSRWKLGRRDVRSPRWTGTETDTRIAYLTTSRVHIVAGDGTDDTAVAPAAPVAPAWQPGGRFTLAYVDPLGRVSGPWNMRSRRFPEPRKLQWSSDGKRLALLTRRSLVLFGSRSATPLSVRRQRLLDVAFRPGSHELAVIRSRAGSSDLIVGSRVLFRGTGTFRSLTWSPDGRWIAVTWPTADQLLFIRVAGPRRIAAVANITEQFGGFPRMEGWVR